MEVSYGEVLRCLLEGIRWLAGTNIKIPVAAKSSIFEACTRLGWDEFWLIYITGHSAMYFHQMTSYMLNWLPFF